MERYPSPTGVSSGPLSATRVRLIESSVLSGIGSPYFATADMPAARSSHVMPASAASRSRTVARLIDGPIPSPGIRVTLVAMLYRDRADGQRIGSPERRPHASYRLTIRSATLLAR